MTRQGFSPLLTFSLVIALLVGMPIASVLLNVFSGGTGETWTHLASTVLPEYIGNTLWLCLGVGLRCDRRRRGHRLAHGHARFPRSPCVRVGAGLAVGHAGVCAGLCLHRFPAVRRAAADDAARNFRLEQGRLLVSRCAHAGRRHHHVRLCPLSLCVHDCPRGISGARQRHAGSRAYAGARTLGQLLSCLPAAGAAGGGCRYCAGADGNAGRLWHRFLFRRTDLHHRHLSRLVFAGRSHRCRSTGGRAARFRHPAAGAGASIKRTSPLPQHHWPQSPPVGPSASPAGALPSLSLFAHCR